MSANINREFWKFAIGWPNACRSVTYSMVSSNAASAFALYLFVMAYDADLSGFVTVGIWLLLGLLLGVWLLAEWMGDDDPNVIADLQGPVLNLASPQSKQAPAILELIETVVREHAGLNEVSHGRMIATFSNVVGEDLSPWFREAWNLG